MKFQSISLGIGFKYDGFYANFEMPFYFIFENVCAYAFIMERDDKGSQLH